MKSNLDAADGRVEDEPAHSGPAEPGRRILRFLAAERMLHWALAIPFVLLYLTALGMAVFYAEAPPRHIRTAFAWLHRGLGLALILLPPAALLLNRREWRAHLENMKEGWRWRREDFRWLLLFPRAALNPRVALPEQGKFNAAEKLNFMMVSATYPFYILTGLLVWLPGVSFLAYLAHLGVALMGVPLVVGHIFMATVNPDTRVGLSGMLSGWVDREWARHHYRRWFRERFEAADLEERLARPSLVRCVSCAEVAGFGTWHDLIQRSFQVDPLCCPACEAPLVEGPNVARPAVGEAIVRHLALRGADEPFEPGETEAA